MSNNKLSSNHIVDANKKVSSVAWYSNEIGKITALALSGKMTGLEWKYLQAKALEQAKEMHKEEIKQAIMFGDCRGQIETYATSEQYYNETFNNHETK